ncbi:hypothetical protein Plhal304r1_c045g0125761 [Plasmopara halstedii]
MDDLLVIVPIEEAVNSLEEKTRQMDGNATIYHKLNETPVPQGTGAIHAQAIAILQRFLKKFRVLKLETCMAYSTYFFKTARKLVRCPFYSI